jgi:septal ring factor EnvC (AmiA/AmiB activator)
MAVDVKASLRQEINRLRRAIAETTSELASLNDGLRRHERALALLGDGAAGARTQQAKDQKACASQLGRRVYAAS